MRSFNNWIKAHRKAVIYGSAGLALGIVLAVLNGSLRNDPYYQEITAQLLDIRLALMVIAFLLTSLALAGFVAGGMYDQAD